MDNADFLAGARAMREEAAQHAEMVASEADVHGAIAALRIANLIRRSADPTPPPEPAARAARLGEIRAKYRAPVDSWEIGKRRRALEEDGPADIAYLLSLLEDR